MVRGSPGTLVTFELGPGQCQRPSTGHKMKAKGWTFLKGSNGRELLSDVRQHQYPIGEGGRSTQTNHTYTPQTHSGSLYHSENRAGPGAGRECPNQSTLRGEAGS